MFRQVRRYLPVPVVCALLWGGRLCAAEPGGEPADFARDIQPVLVQHCVRCHGAEEQQADLRLDSRAGLLAGGISGPAVTAGRSSESRLIDAMRGTEGVTRMPPEDEAPALPSEVIDRIARWIDAGAIGPDTPPPATVQSRGSDHWAFQPVGDPLPPGVRHEAWVRNEIDRFVVARLEPLGLEPSPEADRATLLRRLSLDLVGLPPRTEEVQAFELDHRAEAYDEAVERLLASPHYGERWGRHWLDIARYADSNGYTIDSGRSIWKYRDWVIEALNRDVPFDQFTIEQLAGDMLPDARLDQMVATGFHRNTLVNEEGGTDPEQFRVEAVVDRVATTGAAFLGLTLGCARCHDHKYDPISQREFYELFALFNNCDEPSIPVPTDQQAKELPALLADIAQMEKRLADVDANAGTRLVEWERELNDASRAALPAEVQAALAVPATERSEAQREVLITEFRKHDRERLPLEASLVEQKKRHKQLEAALTTTLVMRERAEPRPTHVHIRGDFLQPGKPVEPGVPRVLPALAIGDRRATRLDFARWLVQPDHPLTPRVTVNRVWQQYFGRGLVATENDFGTQGDRPTHPELLDWLARRFVASGWSLKQLHRLIVGSATYRQASIVRPELAAVDADNRWLGRQARLRLEAEILRDSALSVAGLLSPQVGGPSVYPPQPEGIYRFTQQVKYWKESPGADRYRRGMYTFFWRSSPHPFLTTFDVGNASVSCTRRTRSNTPLQALALANDPSFLEFARGLAQQILASSDTDDGSRLRYAYRHCLARPPRPREIVLLSACLEEERARLAADPDAATLLAGSAPVPPSDSSPMATSGTGVPDTVERAAWTAVARVLLNLDEFLVRE